MPVMPPIICFLLPIVPWLGLALTIRTLRPPAKATRTQTILLLLLGLMFLPVYIAMAKLDQASPHPLLYLTLHGIEGYAIGVAVYFQLRRLNGGRGRRPERPSPEA
jgi:predicted membrane channel-forming protein YqfA (hemolysin III family)